MKNLFLLYLLYSIKELLPYNRFNHLAKLITAVYLCLELKITRRSLSTVYSRILNFVKSFSEFYGDIHLSLKIHYLLHLGESIRRHGPLFEDSTFIFESINGILAAFRTSSRNICEQISTRYQIFRSLRMKNPIPHLKNFTSKKITYTPNFSEIPLLEAASGNVSLPEALNRFKYIFINDVKFEEFRGIFKRKYFDSCIMLTCGLIGLVTHIIEIDSKFYFRFRAFDLVPFEVPNLSRPPSEQPSHITYEVRKSNLYRFIESINVLRKCAVHVENDEITAVSVLPNLTECD